MLSTSSSQPPPLSSIAERGSASGEESEEDEEDEDGGWHVADTLARPRGSLDESITKTGYLWKKGERRKTWKKRWFVLRPAHLAFYKTSAEYKLLRLLDLSEIHSCTPVALKKHANTLGLVSPTRTFYLQAATPQEVQEWVKAINEARTVLLTTSTQNSASSPIPIPRSTSGQPRPQPVSSSPSHSPYGHHLTSSDSEDGLPSTVARSYSIASPAIQPAAGSNTGEVASPPRQTEPVKDPSKTVLSGYLVKCGSRRHNWHKRWFVLSGEKLVYSRSHMDTKPHRQIPLSQILDALEYDLPAHRNIPSVTSPGAASPPSAAAAASTGGDEHESAGTHTFKIVTTKRTLLLCAPSEEEEIKWLSAVRALLARRSGQGVVPGDSPATAAALGAPAPISASASGPASAPKAPAAEHGAVAAASAAANPAGRRRDSIARRLSLGAGAQGTAGAAVAAAAAGVGANAQEAISERQS
ncbi:PH-domain-containing protein [Obba rivulosa]|uniref:PH-domain-containing protein n=1 Tax=Obba rivulosa TaxID=1052685 RepID=A0A8E2B1J0_9APHY|nr:PH-domain-containing protein [Obba rivulosa]